MFEVLQESCSAGRPPARTADDAAPGWTVAAKGIRRLDTIREAVSASIEPHTLRHRGRAEPLDAHNTFGDLAHMRLVRLRYGADMVVTRDPGRDGNGVLVEMALAGNSQIVCGRETLASTPALATVLTPHLPTEIHYSADCDKFVLRLDRERLTRHCEALLGRAVSEPLTFSLALPLAAPDGSDWRRLVRHMADAIGQQSLIVRSPIAAGQFEQMVMTTLLLAQPNTQSHALERPDAAVAPRYVKKAEQFIEANLAEPLSLARLAEAAGVSARSLQTGFERWRGTTPMAHVKRLRLERVRSELIAADPGAVTVTEVALRWGFSNLGKFAGEYRRLTGESPRDTLRR